MATEIERKFLIDISKIVLPVNFKEIKQGYIPRGNGTTVRIRISGDTGYLTIKGQPEGISRSEYEYEIPLDDAEEMLYSLCDKRIIEKKRYEILIGNHIWEIDVFGGLNKGLIVAEVEMSAENENVEMPEWAITDVSSDSRYSNSTLIVNPFCNWEK